MENENKDFNKGPEEYQQPDLGPKANAKGQDLPAENASETPKTPPIPGAKQTLNPDSIEKAEPEKAEPREKHGFRLKKEKPALVDTDQAEDSKTNGKQPKPAASIVTEKPLTGIKKTLSNWKISAGALGLAVLLGIGSIAGFSQSGAKDEQITKLEGDLQSQKKKTSKVKKELEEAKEELKELKNGPSKLLQIVKAKQTDKDWNAVIEAADNLHAKYPGSEEDLQGQELKSAAQAEITKAEEAKKQEEARQKAEEEKRKQEEAARKAEEERQKAEQEAIGYETGISYDQLARFPDQYKDQKVKFTGKVLQILSDDGESEIRLAVNNNYDTVVYGYFPSSLMSQGKILEDDQITIYGVAKGDYSYKAVMGNTITLPLIKVDKIDQ